MADPVNILEIPEYQVAYLEERIAAFVKAGDQVAKQRLVGAAQAIATAAQQLGGDYRAPLVARPAVRIGEPDRDSVTVGWIGAGGSKAAKVLSKNLATAKRREWPRILQQLRDEEHDALETAFRRHAIDTGDWDEGPESKFLDLLVTESGRRSRRAGID